MSGLIRYEWLRLITIRSTWIMLAMPIVVTAAVGWLFGYFSNALDRGGDGAKVSFGLLITASPVMTLAAVFLSVVFAQAIGQEYRHGLIRVTLTQFPHRSRVLVVKIVTMSILVLLMAVIVVAVLWGAAIVGIAPTGGSIKYVAATDNPLIVRALLYVLIFTAIAFAITMITRIIQLGIILPIVLALLVEPIVRVIVLLATIGSGGGGPPDISSEPLILRLLPFTSGQSALSTDGDPWQGLLVFAIWGAALLIPGWILFVRRDA
jgi:ABC-2 type transport system permease protein